MSHKNLFEPSRSAVSLLILTICVFDLVLVTGQFFNNMPAPSNFAPRFDPFSRPFFGGPSPPPMYGRLARQVGMFDNSPGQPAPRVEQHRNYQQNSHEDGEDFGDVGWTDSEKAEILQKQATERDAYNRQHAFSNENRPEAHNKHDDRSQLEEDDTHVNEQRNTVVENHYTDDEHLEENHRHQKTLLNLNFFQNFGAFDPRSPSSEFEFGVIDEATGMRQDNAAFLRAKHGIVSMVTVPMGRWLPQSFGLGAAKAQFDAAAQAKQPITVERGQTLKASLKFNCRTVDVKLHKFPKEAITNANDDPRLATCALTLADLEKTGLEFSIQLTNRGVWGRYCKDPITREFLKADYDAFAVYRRLATRTSASRLVNARIEVDREQQQTRYYVDNKLVWVVKHWGVLTKDLFNGDQYGSLRSRLVSYSPGASHRRNHQLWHSDQPNNFTLFVENTRALDVADPNRHENGDKGGDYSPALVRLTDLPGYYNPNVQFYDEKSLRYSSLWGQGVVAGLKSLRVVIESNLDDERAATDEEASHDSGVDDHNNVESSDDEKQSDGEKRHVENVSRGKSYPFEERASRLNGLLRLNATQQFSSNGSVIQ